MNCRAAESSEGCNFCDSQAAFSAPERLDKPRPGALRDNTKENESACVCLIEETRS